MRNIREHRLPKSSGYDTLFGPTPLARAITQTQAAKISEGSTLEKVVVERASFVLDLSVPNNLALLLSGDLPVLSKPYVVSKNNLKKYLWPALLGLKHANWAEMDKSTQKELMKKHFTHEPDMMVVDSFNNVLTFVELKSFCVFDTEKSSAIAEKMKNLPKPYKMPYQKKAMTVCFYAESRRQIIEGMKKRVKTHQVSTGEEFLKLVSLASRNSIMELTQGSHSDNVLFVLERALESTEGFDPDRVREVLEKFPHIAQLYQKS